MLDIFLTNALAQPGTVMVVILNANVAIFAMVDSFWREYFANVTVTEWKE